MLTIICGTNRIGSSTSKVAQIAVNIAKDSGISYNYIDLADIPNDFIHNEQYSSDAMPDWLKALQEKSIINVNHFLIVSPEYNGSIPGYLKLFIDAISVHRINECFTGKHAALIGLASGRAGNLRGNDHLSAILNHLGCTLVPGSLPISKIGSVLDENGKMEEGTKDAIKALIKKLMAA